MNQPDYLDPDNLVVAEREIRTELILWDMPADQPAVFMAEWIRGKRREWKRIEKSIWNKNRQLSSQLRAVKQSNERYRAEIARRKEEIKALREEFGYVQKLLAEEWAKDPGVKREIRKLRKAGGGGGD